LILVPQIYITINGLSPYLLNSDYCVAGFSCGAQQAFEYVYHSKKRIDRLILLSPAFFQREQLLFNPISNLIHLAMVDDYSII